MTSIGSMNGVNYQPGMQLSASDRVSAEQLNNPGLYTNPQYSGDLTSAVMKDAGIPDPDEHKGGFFSFCGKLLLTALSVTAVAVGLRKGVFNNIKDIDAGEGKLVKLTKDAKFIDKAKYYFAKSTDWVYKNTVERLVNLAKSKEKSSATETEHTVDTEA